MTPDNRPGVLCGNAMTACFAKRVTAGAMFGRVYCRIDTFSNRVTDLNTDLIPGGCSFYSSSSSSQGMGSFRSIVFFKNQPVTR